MPAETFKAARDFMLDHRDDYATAYRDFRWPEVTRFNWALDWFDAELARGASANQPALIITGGDAATLTFAELSERSNRVANGLRALGVKRGDRVLMMLGNVTPLWETMLACMKLGAVINPATTLLTQSDLADRFERGRARHIVTTTAEAAKFDGFDKSLTRIAVGDATPGWHRYDALLKAPAAFTPDGPTNGDDPMLLYFTSGTTSKPKLVLHSHRTYPVGHLTTMFVLGLRPGDIHLNISSPGWAKHAWSSFFAPWNAGATILVLNQRRFDAQGLLQTLTRARVTTFCAPPTVWRMLVQEDVAAHPVHLREAVAAGEPLNPEVIARIQSAWGLTIRDGYGQTETTLQIANTPGQAVQPGAMGHPLPGYDVGLLDPDGAEAEEGEIALRLDPAPIGLMDGYMQDDGSIQRVTGAWYRTGDVALRNPDRSLTYVGRADDVFKSSGYRISPFELESVLIEHPAVAEAAVVPVPDATRTALPKAYIALADGHEPDRETAASIFAHLRARLAPYKRIRTLEFAELPKTISGKIRRVDLRRAEQRRADHPGPGSPAEFRDA